MAIWIKAKGLLSRRPRSNSTTPTPGLSYREGRAAEVTPHHRFAEGLGGRLGQKPTGRPPDQSEVVPGAVAERTGEGPHGRLRADITAGGVTTLDGDDRQLAAGGRRTHHPSGRHDREHSVVRPAALSGHVTRTLASRLRNHGHPLEKSLLQPAQDKSDHTDGILERTDCVLVPSARSRRLPGRSFARPSAQHQHDAQHDTAGGRPATPGAAAPSACCGGDHRRAGPNGAQPWLTGKSASGPSHLRAAGHLAGEPARFKRYKRRSCTRSTRLASAASRVRTSARRASRK